MAEGIFLSSVAEGIIASLGSLTVKEIVQLWGAEGELGKLKDTVSTIKDVLLDAEEQQDGNPEVRVWLEKLKKPMYEADDLLDDVSSEALPEEDKKKEEEDKKKKKVWNFCCKSNQGDRKKKKEWNVFSKSNQVPQHPFHIGRKIKDIREKLDAIAADRKFHLEGHRVKIGIENKKRGDTYSFVREEDIIGREEDKKAVIAPLLNSNVGDNVSILPIVGIGGLGKTALAQLVFNDQKVQQHFELKVWVCVSDPFDVKILVKNILESVTKNKQEDVGMDVLTQSLKKEIDEKKYLLVLDDVWNEDKQKWSSFKALLMGGARGSRVLLTTRNEKVARITKTMEPYLLKGLSEEQSWSLFEKIAFEEVKQPKDARIESIGKEIVAKCVGVPLAIRTIGGFLYFRNPESEWLSFKNTKLSRISQNEEDIIPILKLSYDKLPSHLKQCFAYCSLFPKDCKFEKSTLIRLWMAQGFISEANQHRELEDIGHDYFMHLLWRSFFQEAEVDRFGDVICCKMHDLMHDLATSVAGSLITTSNSIDSIDEKTRHVSIDSFPVVTTSLSRSTRIRTLLFYRSAKTKSTCDAAIFSSFQFLRSLSLTTYTLRFLPNSICELKHLRYLHLNGSEIIKLPDSITSLQNLQTLRLSFPKLEELPRDIRKLVNLRHLEIYGCNALKYMPRGLGELTNLQTLSLFVIPSDSVSEEYGDLSELNKLNSLRGVLEIIIGRHGTDVASQWKAANLKEKKHLRTLQLEWTYESDVSDSSTEDVLVEELESLQPHPNLKSLSIRGYRGGIFPSWLLSLTNLVMLHIEDCQSLTSLPEGMHGLTSLQRLDIRGCQSLTSLPEGMRGLTSLQRLDIRDCQSLTSLPEGMRGLTSLQRLDIRGCQSLTSLPEGMRGLTSLQRLGIRDCQSLTSLPEGMRGLTSLQQLDIQDCQSLTSLPEGMRGLTSLQRLDIGSCQSLTSLPEGMRALTSLQRLDIWDCQSLTSLPEGMRGLTSLQRLDIGGCQSLTSLPEGMRGLTSLQQLDIEDCQSLTSLPEGMRGLTSLQQLDIRDCQSLTSLPEGMRGLTSLQRLHIRDCQSLTSLPEGMRGLTSLQRLHIRGCQSLTSLPEGMRGLTSLQRLDIWNCPSLTSLPEGMCGLTSLQRLHILRPSPILKERCARETGVDWPKISHIPQIDISEPFLY